MAFCVNTATRYKTKPVSRCLHRDLPQHDRISTAPDRQPASCARRRQTFMCVVLAPMGSRIWYSTSPPVTSYPMKSTGRASCTLAPSGLQQSAALPSAHQCDTDVQEPSTVKQCLHA